MSTDSEYRWRVVQRNLLSKDDAYSIFPFKTFNEVLKHIKTLKWYIAFGIEYKPSISKIQKAKALLRKRLEK